jgi:ribosomal protein S18 acetylase RimI-like enzyme
MSTFSNSAGSNGAGSNGAGSNGAGTAGASRTEVRVRALGTADLEAVVALDASLTGEAKATYWGPVVERFLTRKSCIALAASAASATSAAGEPGDGLDGFLFGERRAFEFGSEACGWVLAVGVRMSAARTGVATALMEQARRQFAAMGVTAVRTMVRRTDVPLLSFFRSQGFVGGPFVQLELGLEDADREESAP